MKELYEFCRDRNIGTERQRELLKLVAIHGSNRKAAKVARTHHTNVDRAVKRLKQHAAKEAYAPEHGFDKPVPPGYYLERATIQRGPDGIEKQWDKIAVKREELIEQLKLVASELAEDCRGKAPKTKKPKGKLCEDLLNVFPYGDPHIGLLAHRCINGERYGVEETVADLVTANRELVAGAPPAKHALIANLGDFFHMDDSRSRTPKSGNQLDVDGYWADVVAIGTQAFRENILQALENHEHVHVVNSIGNHDEHAAELLGMLLEAYFENEPRVTFDNSPLAIKKYRWGNVLLGFHHGHLIKPERMGGVMLREWREETGQTEHRHWLTGHIHHRTVLELNDCTVESFRSLVARDKYHVNSGYGAKRDMQRITYHRRHGEWSRQTAPLSYIRELQ